MTKTKYAHSFQRILADVISYIMCAGACAAVCVHVYIVYIKGFHTFLTLPYIYVFFVLNI